MPQFEKTMPSKNVNSKNFNKNLKSPPKNEYTPFQNGRFFEDDISHVAITVGVSPDVAFAFFRDFKNFPLFVKDLKSVQVLTPKKSHWTVEVKGMTAEWDAEIIAEREGEMISWRSVKGSDVDTFGTIWFAPAPEALGTVISLIHDYKVPAKKLTEFITKFTGEDPKSLMFTNLRRLKCYLETGEIATIDGQSSGRETENENNLKH